MKLSGNYSVNDLIQTLQGNFNCQSVTKTAKGKTLDKKDQYIKLELFFIRLEIYADKVIVYKFVSEGDSEKLEKICTLAVASD